MHMCELLCLSKIHNNISVNFTGSFVFIDASTPRKLGDKAILRSQVFSRTAGSGRCLTFWYHMAGSGIGTLNVYLDPVSYITRYFILSNQC